MAVLTIPKNKSPITTPCLKSHRLALYHRYRNKLFTNPDLNRTLVSFQGNKKIAFYRWLKYKEAFSSDLVHCFLDKFQIPSGNVPRILDPFAGVGTTLTTAASAGWKATGIEVLPVGVVAIKARLLADTVSIRSFEYHLRKLEFTRLPLFSPHKYRFSHLRITEEAFPKETEIAISAFLNFISNIRDKDVQFLFWFGCFSILEEISYTRKDGQYLRWDFRCKRLLKSKFSKGTIYAFKPTIIQKLRMMLEDIKSRNGGHIRRNVEVIEGSCLDKLPKMPNACFDMVITSPPYCNRYDYTRTYALELAFMEKDEVTLKNLRQTLLSCTVENKTKRDQLAWDYQKRNQEDRYRIAVNEFNKQQALHEVLMLLYEAREDGLLNNDNIPNLVENYFFEMNLVIHELARVLSPGGRIVMVNDNVQYHGEEIPVDLILSNFATSAGLLVDQILVLQRGKGNSSQQMGAHGRNELRKCVYVWSKPLNRKR